MFSICNMLYKRTLVNIHKATYPSITINMGTVVYFQLIPHTLSCFGCIIRLHPQFPLANLTCSWTKSDTWRRRRRGWLWGPVWISHIHLCRQICLVKQREVILMVMMTWLYDERHAVVTTWTSVRGTYLDCLLRSVTLTFPKTRVRYNLNRERCQLFTELTSSTS